MLAALPDSVLFQIAQGCSRAHMRRLAVCSKAMRSHMQFVIRNDSAKVLQRFARNQCRRNAIGFLAETFWRVCNLRQEAITVLR